MHATPRHRRALRESPASVLNEKEDQSERGRGSLSREQHFRRRADGSGRPLNALRASWQSQGGERDRGVVTIPQVPTFVETYQVSRVTLAGVKAGKF